MIDELAEIRVAGGDDGIDPGVASRVTQEAPELPEDRLHRVTNATTIALFGEASDREAVDKLIAQHPEDERFKALKDMYDAEQQAQFEQGLHLVGRVSAAECDRMYGHGRTVATRARIVMSKIPKFSDRNRGFVAESPTAIRLVWLPYEEVSAL